MNEALRALADIAKEADGKRAEAGDVVDGGHERARGQRPDARNRREQRDRGIGRRSEVARAPQREKRLAESEEPNSALADHVARSRIDRAARAKHGHQDDRASRVTGTLEQATAEPRYFARG